MTIPRRRFTQRLSYANVTATLALLLALGGVSYAAVALPANSVGARQLKTSAVTSKDVKDGALLRKDFKPGQLTVTGATVADGSLTGDDIDESTLALGLGTRVQGSTDLALMQSASQTFPDHGTLDVTCADGGGSSVGLTIVWTPSGPGPIRIVKSTQSEGDAGPAVDAASIAPGSTYTFVFAAQGLANVGRVLELTSVDGLGSKVTLDVRAITRQFGGTGCVYFLDGTLD